MSMVVVVDEGSAQTKITFRDENGQTVTKKIPSRVVSGFGFDSSNNSFTKSSYFAEENGVKKRYNVSSKAEGTIPTNRKSFQTSALNRCLVHEVLRLNGFAGKDVDVSVTLPVGHFYQKDGDSPINQGLINKKIKNLKGDISSACDAPLANIVSVHVYPEAVPAVFDVSRDETGKLNEGYTDGMRFLCIDIGGTTTDVSLISSAGEVEKFDSFDAGVINIAKKFTRLLANSDMPAFQGIDLPLHAAEQALKEKSFAGVDVTSYIEAAYQEFVDKIINDIEVLIDNLNIIDKVIIVGGGASLIGNAISNMLKEVGQSLDVPVIVPNNPDETISRGIFKIRSIATQRQQQKAAVAMQPKVQHVVKSQPMPDDVDEKASKVKVASNV